MGTDLQHEDLLIKLRSKLNDEKIKLWEHPFVTADRSISETLKELATKYSSELSVQHDTVLAALHELQLHSLDRSKENAEYKETGCATMRIKATMPGEKPKIIKVMKKLDVMGSELIGAVAQEVGVVESRVKLICNGRVLKPTPNLEEQGLKNGAQVMALIMAETPEEVQEEEKMYIEMKRTRDDATLLSEYVNELGDEDEYMKLEDQSGNAVELPSAERRALLVGLALHERARKMLKNKEYPNALVLLLEADQLLSECRSSVLQVVDNVGVLQLDIAWCYLCIQCAPPDLPRRLAAAHAALSRTYGANAEREAAILGHLACERVLFMRLYLLQGILAYHQNKRDEARSLLEKAEQEINGLRVEAASVSLLTELGWSEGSARAGLRAAGGDPRAAHDFLYEREQRRREKRDQYRRERKQRKLGFCPDGSPVSARLVSALVAGGASRRAAVRALRLAGNDLRDARAALADHPELCLDSDESAEGSDTPSSEDSTVEPDSKLLAELTSMGYGEADARTALCVSRNDLAKAVDMLLAAGGQLASSADTCKPSTSAKAAPAAKKHKKPKKDEKHKERKQALRRLKSAIKTEADDYLDSSLVDEEEFLVQYKSLL